MQTVTIPPPSARWQSIPSSISTCIAPLAILCSLVQPISAVAADTSVTQTSKPQFRCTPYPVKPDWTGCLCPEEKGLYSAVDKEGFSRCLSKPHPSPVGPKKRRDQEEVADKLQFIVDSLAETRKVADDARVEAAQARTKSASAEVDTLAKVVEERAELVRQKLDEAENAAEEAKKQLLLNTRMARSRSEGAEFEVRQAQQLAKDLPDYARKASNAAAKQAQEAAAKQAQEAAAKQAQEAAKQAEAEAYQKRKEEEARKSSLFDDFSVECGRHCRTNGNVDDENGDTWRDNVTIGKQHLNDPCMFDYFNQRAFEAFGRSLVGLHESFVKEISKAYPFKHMILKSLEVGKLESRPNVLYVKWMLRQDYMIRWRDIVNGRPGDRNIQHASDDNLPVDSRESGQRLVRLMRELAAACGAH